VTRRARNVLGAAALLALLGPLAVDALWTTDEERVGAALDAMEVATEARDADALAGWFAEHVEVPPRFPGVPARGTLAESMRTAFDRTLRGVWIDRDATEVTFPEADRAHVKTSGTITIEVEGYRVPQRFEIEVDLRRADDRFLLERIERVELRPILG
jgi:hypothetical protein